ncbi:hypothetical protein BGX28_000217 [Mortierella sp. GBA30]|nr:hypothetical protein BGX28_000217 [Mortierella sp. GBA30]
MSSHVTMYRTKVVPVWQISASAREDELYNGEGKWPDNVPACNGYLPPIGLCEAQKADAQGCARSLEYGAWAGDTALENRQPESSVVAPTTTERHHVLSQSVHVCPTDGTPCRGPASECHAKPTRVVAASCDKYQAILDRREAARLQPNCVRQCPLFPLLMAPSLYNRSYSRNVGDFVCNRDPVPWGVLPADDSHHYPAWSLLSKEFVAAVSVCDSNDADPDANLGATAATDTARNCCAAADGRGACAVHAGLNGMSTVRCPLACVSCAAVVGILNPDLARYCANVALDPDIVGGMARIGEWVLWGSAIQHRMLCAVRAGAGASFDTSAHGTVDMFIMPVEIPATALRPINVQRGSGLHLNKGSGWSSAMRELRLDWPLTLPSLATGVALFEQLYYGHGPVARTTAAIDCLFYCDYGLHEKSAATSAWLHGVHDTLVDAMMREGDDAVTLIAYNLWAGCMAYSYIERKYAWETNLHLAGLSRSGLACRWSNVSDWAMYCALDSGGLRLMADTSQSSAHISDLAVTRMMNDLIDAGYDLASTESASCLGVFCDTISYASLSDFVALTHSLLHGMATSRAGQLAALSCLGTHYWQITDGRHRVLQLAYAARQVRPAVTTRSRDTVFTSHVLPLTYTAPEWPPDILKSWPAGASGVGTGELTTACEATGWEPGVMALVRELLILPQLYQLGLHEGYSDPRVIDRVAELCGAQLLLPSVQYDVWRAVLWQLCLAMWGASDIMYAVAVNSLAVYHERCVADERYCPDRAYTPWGDPMAGP